ncbi:hypothetical protein F5X99DRAFT_270251 [Biscogniauxia marginata]|nr:hypothetical protein F5X99DRAFT_270251 [Biscogniauxia marginata]
MCVRSSQHFIRCCHVDTKLAHCPSYHKQQSSGKGLFGFLFKKRKKEDCGRVIPHYIKVDAFCQACTIKNASLKTRNIGDGAFKVQRSIVEDDFRDARKQTAKESISKTARHDRHGKKHSHEVIIIKPSVWIPDLYHHPQTMGKHEKYAREAAPAPPVSSRPAKSSLRQSSSHNSPEKRKKCTTRDGHLKRNYAYEGHMAAPGTLSVSADRTPAFGNSEPLRIPAQPVPAYQYRGKFAANAPSLPPACRLPPLPLAMQKATSSKPPRPIRESGVAGTTGSRTQYPGLRRKEGRIYNIVPAAPTPRAPVPVPEYQVYLNAMSFAAEQSPSDTQKLAKLMHNSPLKARPNSRHQHAKEEPRRSALQNLMGRSSTSKPSDDSSDVSFVCQDAKKLIRPHAGRKLPDGK